MLFLYQGCLRILNSTTVTQKCLRSFGEGMGPLRRRGSNGFCVCLSSCQGERGDLSAATNVRTHWWPQPPQWTTQEFSLTIKGPSGHFPSPPAPKYDLLVPFPSLGPVCSSPALCQSSDSVVFQKCPHNKLTAERKGAPV